MTLKEAQYLAKKNGVTNLVFKSDGLHGIIKCKCEDTALSLQPTLLSKGIHSKINGFILSVRIPL